MSHLHHEFPSSSIYFTEGSVYGIAGARSIVQYFRNWAQSYNAWVTLLDDHGHPNSGPFAADATMVQLNSSDGSITYRYEYFMYGHFSKFIRPGALRVSSEFLGPPADVDHVAFVHACGRHAVVLVASSGQGQGSEVELQWEGWRVSVPVCSGCVVTLVW
jgi:O-glycosyl hydrolase